MVTATNPELEARIRANLDDRAAYEVYGDWLSERGDPRGELIAVQLKLEQHPDDAGLKARAAQLLDDNKDIWLGELASLDPINDLHVVWRWGFIDRAYLGPTEDYENSNIDFPDTIAKLMKLPGIGFLRELVIGAMDADDYPTSWSSCIEALAEASLPTTLRRFECSRGYWDISSTELGDLSPLYPQLAGLEELRIELGAMALGAINLPSLETLEIVTGGLTADNLRSINGARWPALETLSLCIGETGNDYGCDVEFADLEPVLAAENLPKVKHLALANSSLADQIAAALPTSRILPRLATLDLSKGMMSDDGARAILDHWDAFAHLASLDLSHAYLSDALADQLRAKGTVVLDDLQPPDEDYRYCQISE